MVQASDLSISSGSDTSTITSQATQLVDNGRWHLCNSGKGLERGFKFKTFNQTWSFMDAVAQQCKKAKHHPEWSNVYNRVHIRWTTHNPEGLSERDTSMVAFCDEVAVKFGEVMEEGEGKGSGKVEAKDWRAETKDCCGHGSD